MQAQSTAAAENCRGLLILCRYHRKFKDLEALSQRGMLCMSAVPVCTAGEAMGCIIVANKEADHFTQDDQVRLRGQSLLVCCLEAGPAAFTRGLLRQPLPSGVSCCVQVHCRRISSLPNNAPAVALTHLGGPAC